ncbi:gliding motility-associated C-terminal domain-containing protein [Mucilaginibacter lutimaris]|uniref:Gliding motility-associated C-terminal domain-containing protein n=1 Tax=Mucilaginibacter lutimaris TaxID=931629 RepID=A0ABW2ZIE3_9SPHI
MLIKRLAILLTFILLLAKLNSFAYTIPLTVNKSALPADSSTFKPLKKIVPNANIFGRVLATSCYDINWATWPSQSNVSSLTGTITDTDGSQIGITMSANYNFGTTPSIYTFSNFNGYPSTIPNSTVPKTEWTAGANGSTDMCFSKKVTNPVLLLSSLGNSQGLSARLSFSVPYVVLYDGGHMVYNNSTSLTGTEGYAIIMFPGDFTCVNIQSSTPENYTNLTWGIRPQPFAINITDGSNTCSGATVTATGGVTYKWDGGDTPNQATNTFHQSGTYVVTVTNASGCVTSASKKVVLGGGAIPGIASFTIPEQNGPAVIDHNNKTIALTVPPGTDRFALRPTVTTTAGATVTPVSGTLVNFNSPVDYIVSNGCTQVTYKVTVSLDNKVTNIGACPGDVVSLTGDILPTPADNYTWQMMSAGVWVNAAGAIDQVNYTTTAQANLTGANTIITYRRAITQAGITTYDSYYQLTVAPSTDQNIISVDKQVACGTGVVLYMFTGNRPIGYTPATTYTWQRSTDGVNFQDYVNITSENWFLQEQINTKTWFRRASVTGACRAYSNVVTIDYIPGLGPASVGPPVTLCNVTSYTLTGNTPAADEMGTWSVVSASGYNPFTPTNIHDPNAHITGMPLNSQFDFTWTISKASCDKTSSASVFITNGINSTITDFNVPGQDGPAIINQANRTITLTISPKTNKAHLTPLIATSNGILSPVSGVEQDFTGTVTYRLTDACAFVDYKVTIINAVVSNLHACQSSTFNILLPGNNVAGVFQWQVYQGGIWQDIGTGATNNDYVAGYNNTATANTVVRSYRRRVINNAIAIYDSYTDVYFEPPVSNNQITADRQSVCAAGSNIVTLSGNIPTGGSGNITYQWRYSTDNVLWQNINNATQKDYQFNFISTSSMYYTRVARSNSCDEVSNSVKVDYVGPATVADAGNAQSVCGLTQLTLAANAPKPNEVGTWSVISPAGYNPFNTSNINNPHAIINGLPVDTDVELKWSITEGGCNQLSESFVTVHSTSKPLVSTGAEVTIDRGESITLAGSVLGGNFPYQWSPATGLSDPNILNPIASPIQTTIYTLTAFNGANCSATATVKVIVNNDLKIPNTITPNNDGINDEWVIKNIDDYKNVTVQIFDRIGRQVFNSVGYPKRWDATYNGEKLPAAVYYYIILLKDVKYKKAGWITVIY